MQIEINSREGYDIATALRGPDNDNDFLKGLFTAPLRFECGIPESNNNQFGCKSSWDDWTYSDDFIANKLTATAAETWTNGHFLNHARQGWEAMYRLNPENVLYKKMAKLGDAVCLSWKYPIEEAVKAVRKAASDAKKIVYV